MLSSDKLTQISNGKNKLFRAEDLVLPPIVTAPQAFDVTAIVIGTVLTGCILDDRSLNPMFG